MYDFPPWPDDDYDHERLERVLEYLARKRARKMGQLELFP